MVKFFFYFFSLATISLILLSSPKAGNGNTSSSNKKTLSFSSSQIPLQRLTAFTVLMFFIFVVLSLLIR